MTHVPLSIGATLLASTGLSVSCALAGESTATAVPECRVKLEDADLQAITLEVLKVHPMLSASTGIKYADALCGYASMVDAEAASPSVIMANVFFHPHTETHGIKQAFETHCQRSASSQAWSCATEIRRYVKLDSQDFEVRVKGNLDLAGIQAVIEATRQPAALAGLKYSEVADTAHVILACSDGFVVSWGNKDGSGGLGLDARLRAGGIPADPNDSDVNALPVL